MDLKRIDAAIASYARSGDQDLADRLNFFRGIWEIQNQYAQKAAGLSCCPSVEDLKQWYWSGEILLGKVSYEVAVDELAQIAADIAQYLVEQGSFDDDVMQTFKRLDWVAFLGTTDIALATKRPVDYLDSVIEVLKDNDALVRDDFIIVVLSLALRAVLDPVAHQLLDPIKKQVIKESVDRTKLTCCPVCGGKPAIAVVGKTEANSGNTRTMWCSQCGTSWDYERLGCPHCFTHNQEHLHYVNIDGDETHRLYYCDECQGFLRTTFDVAEIPSRNDVPLSFEVEDVVMAPLNLVAEEILN